MFTDPLKLEYKKKPLTTQLPTIDPAHKISASFLRFKKKSWLMIVKL
jgi:hypothetical protein